MIDRPFRPVLVGLPSAGALLLVTVALGGCGGQEEPADLVLLHGTIVTVVDDAPRAQAVAIRGDRIVAVGSDAEIEGYVGASTATLDLQGALAIPGFVEGHAHFLSVGQSRLSVRLGGARTWDETVERVAEAARKAPPGQWIVGRGWHQEKWDAVPTPNVRGFPVHDALSRVSPDNPVVLGHASGHASIANANAMKRAGITASTPDPPGGAILRDADGRPAGVFLETAEELIGEAYEADVAARSPEEVEAERIRLVELAAAECVSKGITSFHDAGSDFETVDLLARMVDEGRLGVRLYVMLGVDDAELASRLPEREPRVGYGDHRLTVRAIKKYIDGALGVRGAWLLEPYTDLPGSAGHNTESLESLAEVAGLAIEHGYQLCVHAIGDRGNREILDLYETTFRNHPEKTDLRWRIEHAQHLHPDDIPRFSRLGVIAAMQGIHCTSDAPWVVTRLGEERAREGAYAWRALIDAGAVVVNGTDAPVEDVDPIGSFHASVTRRLDDGSEFFPEQRMSREEALRSYTLDAAYAAFEEELKGSLAPGKLADITVLSRDILTVPDDRIPGTEVLYTIVGGEVVYRRTSAVD